MATLEARYRRLLFMYPKEYRREHADEIASILVEASDPGRRWPSARETAGLIVGGLRTRGLLATRRGGHALLADGIRLAVVLVLGLRLMDYARFVRIFPLPAIAPLPEEQWISALFLSLGLLAVVRGAWRSAVALIVAGAVASMFPTGLFIFGGLGATPFSSSTALLALSAVLVVVQHCLDRSSRPWSWWLAVAVVGVPMLNTQAHEWYMAYVVQREDTNYAPYISWGVNLVDQVISVSVPCVLIVVALIGRDPRLSLAVAVTTGTSLLATLYASAAFSLHWHVVPWQSLSGFFAQPTVIIVVSLMTTAATFGTRPRLLGR